MRFGGTLFYLVCLNKGLVLYKKTKLWGRESKDSFILASNPSISGTRYNKQLVAEPQFFLSHYVSTLSVSVSAFGRPFLAYAYPCLDMYPSPGPACIYVLLAVLPLRTTFPYCPPKERKKKKIILLSCYVVSFVL